MARCTKKDYIAASVFGVLIVLMVIWGLKAAKDGVRIKKEIAVNDARIKAIDIQMAYDEAYWAGMNDTLSVIEIDGTNVSIDIVDMIAAKEARLYRSKE